MPSPTLLIPIEFPDPDPLPSSFVSGFTSCRVVLLGIYEMPDDVDPDERQRREVEANHTLYSLAHQFVRNGETAEVELVTGQGLEGTPTAVAEERDVDALLVPNPITHFGRVLIAVRDETFAESIATFVSTLDEDVIHHTTLLNVTDADDAEEKSEMLAALKGRLVDAGFSEFSIDTEVVESDDPPFEISQKSRDYDLIIMGETGEPTFERVFGSTYQTIADQTHLPVVVIRE